MITQYQGMWEKLYQQTLLRHFNAIARQSVKSDKLTLEVGQRLERRLSYIRVNPQRIVELGAGLGGCSQLLRHRYPKARLVSCDIAANMLAEHKASAKRSRRRHYVAADMRELPFTAQSIDLVFANMSLFWLWEPQRAFEEIRRVLSSEGVFMFSTLGPDTLSEAKAAWSEVDQKSHVHNFIDMHDLGDMMVKAGLVDPVTDAEWLTVNYSQPRYLLEDLKSAGSRVFAQQQEVSGLWGPSHLQRFARAYQSYQDDHGRYPATFEVIYGHAWGNALPASKEEAGTVTIAADSLKQSIKRR